MWQVRHLDPVRHAVGGHGDAWRRAPNPMAILAVHAHRCRLGGLHGSPCAAVKPARPTTQAGPAYHLSAGSNNRTPVVGVGSFAPPEAVVMSQPADLPHRDPPYSRHAKPIAGHVLALERRHAYVRRHTRPGARRSTLHPWIPLASSTGTGSETAVRRRLTETTAIEGDQRQVFPQVNAGVVGLAGLEPAPSSFQVSRAQRCADRRFPRSFTSVGGEGMRSYRRP